MEVSENTSATFFHNGEHDDNDSSSELWLSYGGRQLKKFTENLLESMLFSLLFSYRQVLDSTEVIFGNQDIFWLMVSQQN